jgi:putative ABC transport system ATP-binding protein
MATSNALIQVDHLYLEAGSDENKVKILQDISFDVQKGETVSVVGPSGSGKTSLMMVMAGLMRATQGDVFFDGQGLSTRDEDELAQFRHNHIGIVFQNFHLIPSLNAIKNVSFALDLVGAADAEKRAKEWLERVGLSHRMTHMPSQLSGGEQQRVALARALVTQPSFIMADEPTGNLDHENSQKISDMLFEMAAEHDAALMLITHDQDMARRSDRQITLIDGRIDSMTNKKA